MPSSSSLPRALPPGWGHGDLGTDLSAVRDRLERRFQVVAGKGGVGRTLVAAALAVRAAQRGHRTLLLEVDAPDAAAGQLAVAPAVDTPREVMNNLWLCRMTPAGALEEYALMVLKFRALYNLVFENRLVKYLLRSIPSLGEFTMLGKAWFHTTESLPDGGPRFERVIIDAPATGHAVTFLSLARLVANVSPPGIMKDAAEKMAGVIESPSQSCMHIVALPEEMPVNEGVELCRARQKTLGMAPGLGIMNRMAVPRWSEADQGILEALDGAAHPELEPYIRVARLRQDRVAEQVVQARRFGKEAGLPTFWLPDYGSVPINPDLLNRVGTLIDEVQDG